jgi:nitrilase
MGSPSVCSSAIIGPDGRLLTPKEHPNEKLIVADLDLSQVIKAKTFADASGHCEVSLLTTVKRLTTIELICGTDSRPDLLWLGADPSLKPIIKTMGL